MGKYGGRFGYRSRPWNPALNGGNRMIKGSLARMRRIGRNSRRKSESLLAVRLHPLSNHPPPSVLKAEVAPSKPSANPPSPLGKHEFSRIRGGSSQSGDDYSIARVSKFSTRMYLDRDLLDYSRCVLNGSDKFAGKRWGEQTI